MFDALRNHDDPGIAPLPHAERLAGSIEAPRRRHTAARVFAVAIEISAGLIALVAALALVA